MLIEVFQFTLLEAENFSQKKTQMHFRLECNPMIKILVEKKKFHHSPN